jgi:hypothetical protein
VVSLLGVNCEKQCCLNSQLDSIAHIYIRCYRQKKIQKKETVQEYFLIMKELVSRGNVEDNAPIQYIIDGITSKLFSTELIT